MNSSRLKHELLAVRARVDALLEEVEKDGPAQNDAEVLFMPMADYARRCNVDESTVRKWVKAGLPHRRRGRMVLVDVQKADTWEMKKATERAADRAAHGGSRR